MSYQPFDRNPSGIVYFGTSVTDQVYESSSNFTFGADILTVPNITIEDGGEIGSATTPNAVTIAANGAVTIAGDLTVNGTQTILNTETLEVEDNIVLLNSNVTGSPTLDAGLEVERGTESNVFITYDEGNDNWHFTNDGSTYHDMWTGLTVGGDVNADESIVEGETFTVAGGSGITTSMSANTVTLDVDATVISGQTSITSADSTDELLILDGDGQLKRISKGNLVSDLGGGTVTSVGVTSDTLTVSNSPITTSGDIDIEVKVDDSTIGHNGTNQLEVKDGGIGNVKLVNDSLTLAADTGTAEDAALGETVTIAGGDAADTVVSATNTVTVNVKYDDTTIGLNGSGELEVKDTTIDTPSDGTTISDDVNLVTTGASTVTLTLPAVSSGRKITVKKVDSGVGTVVIQRNSTDTIDGAISKTLYYQYESLTVICDGTNWFII